MTIPPPAPSYCTEVTPDCPVEGTIYGYYPTIGWNAAFAGFFTLTLVVNIVLGMRYRTWTYGIAMSLGCIGETVGYIGRVIMWIFIGCDLLSLVLQGVGGGMAAAADFGSDMQDVGTDLMLAGVIWQVVCLTFFGYFLGEYLFRTYRHRKEISSQAMELFCDTKFRLFLMAIVTAYITILVRFRMDGEAS